MSELQLEKFQNRELLEKGIIFKFCEEHEKKELYELFLEILKEGNSYLQSLPYSYKEFLDCFFSENSRVLICKKDKDNEVIGGFYIKPNFPGKGNHIANCGYIVKREYRGLKIGFHLGKCSIDIAKELGYRSIIFNCVFKENIAAIKLWKKFGFTIIGTIPRAIRTDDGQYWDAYIMFLELTSP